MHHALCHLQRDVRRLGSSARLRLRRGPRLHRSRSRPVHARPAYHGRERRRAPGAPPRGRASGRDDSRAALAARQNGRLPTHQPRCGRPQADGGLPRRTRPRRRRLGRRHPRTRIPGPAQDSGGVQLLAGRRLRRAMFGGRAAGTRRNGRETLPRTAHIQGDRLHDHRGGRRADHRSARAPERETAPRCQGDGGGIGIPSGDHRGECTAYVSLPRQRREPPRPRFRERGFPTDHASAARHELYRLGFGRSLRLLARSRDDCAREYPLSEGMRSSCSPSPKRREGDSVPLFADTTVQL